MRTTELLPMLEKLNDAALGALQRCESRIKGLEARLATLEGSAGKSAGALRMKSKDDHASHRAGDLVRDADGTVWYVVAHTPRPRYRRVDD